MEQKHLAVIFSKESARLSNVSNDVRICSKTELILKKEMFKMKFPRVNREEIENKTLETIFPTSDHSLLGPLEYHANLLPKVVINIYCNIRIKYGCNISTVDKIRSHFTKVIQFRGQ